MNVDVQNNELCIQHFVEAIRERGEVDLHITATSPECVGAMVILPQCQHGSCERPSAFRVWPVPTGDQ